MAIEAEALRAILKQHIKVDATGLSPAVASAFVTGFNEAVEAIRSALAEDTARAAEGQIPDGWKLVPAGATEAMQRAGMNKALRISLGGDYGWFDYMADLYHTMLAAAPALPLTKETAHVER